MRSVSLYCAASALTLLTPAAEAQAANVTFTGTIANLCVLTLTTPGTMGVAAGGTSMSTDETGGLPATMTVVATGSNPTISFSAPTLSGPAASTGSATKEIGYTSLGGASQAYTGAVSNSTMTRLTDTYSVKGRVTNSSGFVSGIYNLATTATCQQQ